MSLTDKDIDEFILIAKEETGKDLSRDEAWELATRLLNLGRAIYRPIPKKALKKD